MESEVFHTKHVNLHSGTQTIVLQNENGPCALVAIANVLALEDSPIAAFLSSHNEMVEEAALKQQIGETASQLNADDENLSALFEFMPKLSKGLDVNPKFDGTFADSPELKLFAAFNIQSVHTWVLGEQERAELGLRDDKSSRLSYEEMCALQFSDDPSPESGIFLENYPSQMTLSGVKELKSNLEEDKPVVMFWNNHFSTIIKHKNHLFSLVTDLGFQNKREIVWEEIDYHGAGNFVNGQFRPSDEQEKADAASAQRLADEEESSYQGARQQSNVLSNDRSSSKHHSPSSAIKRANMPNGTARRYSARTSETSSADETTSKNIKQNNSTVSKKDTHQKKKSDKGKKCIIS